MARHSPLATPWQKARVRAAILGRYCWGNWAVFFEAVTWTILILAGAALASTEDAGHLAVRLGMAVTMLAGFLALDAARYHWRQALIEELFALDQAVQHVQQAGEQPAAH
jgi:hypothetical protein